MKPWGEVGWLLSKLPGSGRPLLVLGAASSEERCSAVPRLALMRGAEKVRLLKIDDPPSRFTRVIEEKIAANIASIAANEDRIGSLLLPLFADDQAIASGLQDASFLSSAECDLWIDVSSLPKRFFFLLIKLALRDIRISTLVVTYTQPAPGRYTEEHLSEDPSDIQPLPGYGPQLGEPDRLIVAVGFEALGLPQLLGEYRDKKRDITIIIPFPPGQPYSRRIWETVRSIGHPGDANIRRVPAVDAFGAYSNMIAGTDRVAVSNRPPALAPYGPKPISLGMCLYAIQFGCPVYYTQPRVYHPDYTSGIGKTWAYCLKLAGTNTWLDSVS